MFQSSHKQKLLPSCKKINWSCGLKIAIQGNIDTGFNLKKSAIRIGRPQLSLLVT